MTFQFPLAACAEMISPDRPLDWGAFRLKEMGYRGPVVLESFARGDEDIALEVFRAAFTIKVG